MSDGSSGFPLLSRDAQDFPPGPSWPEPAADSQRDLESKASVALTILSEKIRSGALERTELMQRIVDQALAATGANGVALALRRDAGPVVCCAAAGTMAPPPGTVLDESSGFTAECLRNGVVMICEDSEKDEHVDRLACSRLGVRSIVAAPVENEGSTVGVLEALSDQAAPFFRQHIEVLVTLACFAKSVVTPTDSDSKDISPRVTAAAPIVPPTPTLDLSRPDYPNLLERVEDTWTWSERVPRRVRLAIAGGVAAALLFALFATALFIWMRRHNSEAEVGKAQHSVPPAQVSTKPPAAIGSSLPPRGSGSHHQDHLGKPLVLKASAIQKIPGGEPSAAPAMKADSVAPPQEHVFPPVVNSPPGTEQTAELHNVLSIPERLPTPSLPRFEGVTLARLEHRVEPLYPPEAKRLRIEGAVVLRATVDAEGRVKSIGVVKGSPILARAAIAAVRQWHYQPSQLNHRPTASATDITIVFHLQ